MYDGSDRYPAGYGQSVRRQRWTASPCRGHARRLPFHRSGANTLRARALLAARSDRTAPWSWSRARSEGGGEAPRSEHAERVQGRIPFRRRTIEKKYNNDAIAARGRRGRCDGRPTGRRRRRRRRGVDVCLLWRRRVANARKRGGGVTLRDFRGARRAMLWRGTTSASRTRARDGGTNDRTKVPRSPCLLRRCTRASVVVPPPPPPASTAAGVRPCSNGAK